MVNGRTVVSSMTIAELKPGQSALVSRVGGEGALRQHFLDMGVIPGAALTVVKLAPMGDPMELRIHGYELTLRLDDAARIEVEPLDALPAAESMESRTRETEHPGLIPRGPVIRFRMIRCLHLLWSETRTAARRPCSTS